MTEKVLGKITRAEFGTVKDQPFLIGLQLSFSFGCSAVSDGGKYAVNINRLCRTWEQGEPLQTVSEHIEDIYSLLNAAKVHYVSELIGKPVEITLDGNMFKGFRLLTEVL